MALNSLRMRNFSGEISIEYENTFMFKFFSENRAVYEIMWKILYCQKGHRQIYNAVQKVRLVYRVTKARTLTHTLTHNI